MATQGARGGARRKRYILDHLATLSADLVRATGELADAVNASPCSDCHRDDCICDVFNGQGGGDLAVAEQLQVMADGFENALDKSRADVQSSSDEESSSDDDGSSDSSSDSSGVVPGSGVA